MNDFLSRRSLLTGFGATAISGSLASQIVRAGEAAEPAPAPAAPAAQEMVYTTMFMTGAKTKFDAKKYQTKHLPMLKQTYGASISRIEMRTANSTARGEPTPIGVTTSVYIADLQGFIKVLQTSGVGINADLDGIASGPRNIQVDRLLSTYGQPRSELRENHQVVATYYKDQPDAKFDTKYYLETYMPKFRSYYGDGAVRRIEVYMGVPQGGAKPAIMASTLVYIRDRDSYNTGNTEGQRETMRLDVNYTNTTQMWADSKITAIL